MFIKSVDTDVLVLAITAFQHLAPEGLDCLFVAFGFWHGEKLDVLTSA